MENAAVWRKRKMIANLDEIAEILDWFGETESDLQDQVAKLKTGIEGMT